MKTLKPIKLKKTSSFVKEILKVNPFFYIYVADLKNLPESEIISFLEKHKITPGITFEANESLKDTLLKNSINELKANSVSMEKKLWDKLLDIDERYIIFFKFDFNLAGDFLLTNFYGLLTEELFLFLIENNALESTFENIFDPESLGTTIRYIFAINILSRQLNPNLLNLLKPLIKEVEIRMDNVFLAKNEEEKLLYFNKYVFDNSKYHSLIRDGKKDLQAKILIKIKEIKEIRKVETSVAHTVQNICFINDLPELEYFLTLEDAEIEKKLPEITENVFKYLFETFELETFIDPTTLELFFLGI